MLLFAIGSMVKGNPAILLDEYYVSFDNGKTERRLNDEEASLYGKLSGAVCLDFVYDGYDAVRVPAPENCIMVLRYHNPVGTMRYGQDDKIYITDIGNRFEIYFSTPQDINMVFIADEGYSDLAKEIYESLR